MWEPWATRCFMHMREDPERRVRGSSPIGVFEALAYDPEVRQIVKDGFMPRLSGDGKKVDWLFWDGKIVNGTVTVSVVKTVPYRDFVYDPSGSLHSS